MDGHDRDQGVQVTLAILRRRARWILLCFVAATAVAFALSTLQARAYTATAELYFGNSQLAQAVAGLQVSSSSAGSQSTQDTNILLLQLGDVARKTAVALGHGLTPSAVAHALSVSPVGDTFIVNVTATAGSPHLAAAIANTYSAIFVNEQATANHQQYVSALATINAELAKLSAAEKAGPQGQSLQDRAQSLATLAELPSGGVQVAGTASTPRSPSAPKTKRNTILGAVFGLLLGLGLAFLLERLDQRIREPKDLERIYELPLLGVVPESAALSRLSRRDRGSGLAARDAEAFHLIRAHLRYFEVDRDLRTLLIASAASGDGKTTVARCLATAAAQMGARVLLLEADLRRPTLALQLGIDAGPGLADVLIGATSLSDATQMVDVDPVAVDPVRGRPLAVLVAGATPPPNPGALLESHAMERVLEHSRVAYDLIVIDTAPLTVVSDSFSLLRKADGIIIVGRLGVDRRDVAQRLRQTLAGGGSPVLGVIANGFKARRNASYGYGYGYSADEYTAPSASLSR